VTTAAFLLLAVTLAWAVGDWLAVHHGNTRLEYVCKPATMVALAGVAVSLDPRDPVARAWFVVALVLSLAGDVFLMLPGDLFLPGLASFLLAHIAYAVGLAVDGVHPGSLAVGVVVVAAAFGLVGLRLLAGVRAREPALAGPVAGYMAVISLMVVCAIGTRHTLAIVGAALFYASDALIGWNRFVRPVAGGDTTIMVTYHLGQILLVLSLI
jgi:uncharacterized membrane protein YhhN